MNQRGLNFGPGPALLPETVLKQAQEDLWNYKGSGMGVAEISHRSPLFEEILQEANDLLRKLMGIPRDYSILYCTGGATQQFSMVPMNLLRGDRPANYLVAGIWGELAAQEAQKFGQVHIAASSKESKFRSVPTQLNCQTPGSYLHFTSNNTVVGTQSQVEPQDFGLPLICDASSDILSRPIPLEKYSLIYAGAQKNLGPAGVTLVIMRNSLLEEIPDKLPILMDYRTYAKNSSLYNTPPTLCIYFIREALRWLDSKGGTTGIEKINRRKADLLYERIDKTDFYQGIAEKESRSRMNITFRLSNPDLEKLFLEQAEKIQLFGLKGHRFLGGLRASLYNAFPLDGVRQLISFMDDFERRHG